MWCSSHVDIPCKSWSYTTFHLVVRWSCQLIIKNKNDANSIYLIKGPASKLWHLPRTTTCDHCNKSFLRPYLLPLANSTGTLVFWITGLKYLTHIMMIFAMHCITVQCFFRVVQNFLLNLSNPIWTNERGNTSFRECPPNSAWMNSPLWKRIDSQIHNWGRLSTSKDHNWRDQFHADIMKNLIVRKKIRLKKVRITE